MRFAKRVFGPLTAAAVISVLGGAQLVAAPAEFAAPATPHGVTIQPGSPAGYDGTGASGPYFGDARGMTLYTFDKDPAGQSVCDTECAAARPPLIASADAAPKGHLSVVTRADGAKQWAYLGYAMYTYTGDEPGTIRGHDIYDLAGKVPNFKGPPNNSGVQALYWRVALP